MKVLLIDVNCKSGSTGKIVYDLYSKLNANGDEAAICYGRGAKIIEKNIFKFGYDWETYLHAFLTRITGWTGCFSYFSTKRLIRFIRQYKPDVINIHELHAYFVNISQLLQFIAKEDIPVVHTLHCEFSYTGKCGHSVECTKWKDECHECSKVNEYPASFFFDRSRSMFLKKKKVFDSISHLTIVSPSRWLANRIKQSFLGTREIKIINNGIDTENIFFIRDHMNLKKKHNISNNTRVVLSVAPDIMRESKGGRWIVKLASEMSDKDVVFIMIGVLDLSETFPKNVIALGRTDNQQELAEYYSMADCFVICSSHENFPTTCVESLCCGTPVAGFDVGGTAETAPSPFGLFCEYGNLSELRRLVLHFIENPIQQKDFDAIRFHYSSKRMYRDYYELIHEMFLRP